MQSGDRTTKQNVQNYCFQASRVALVCVGADAARKSRSYEASLRCPSCKPTQRFTARVHMRTHTEECSGLNSLSVEKPRSTLKTHPSHLILRRSCPHASEEGVYARMRANTNTEAENIVMYKLRNVLMEPALLGFGQY